MKATLEYNGEPLACARDKRPADIYGTEIMLGKTLTICARCDPDRTLAQSITKAGYKLTHGVCLKHEAEFEKGR